MFSSLRRSLGTVSSAALLLLTVVPILHSARGQAREASAVLHDADRGLHYRFEHLFDPGDQETWRTLIEVELERRILATRTWAAAAGLLSGDSPSDPVLIRLILRPEHRTEADRILRAAVVGLRCLDAWVGPWPTPTLTITDPGLEPDGGGDHEGVVVVHTRFLPHAASTEPERSVWRGLARLRQRGRGEIGEALSLVMAARIEEIFLPRRVETTLYGRVEVASTYVPPLTPSLLEGFPTGGLVGLFPEAPLARMDLPRGGILDLLRDRTFAFFSPDVSADPFGDLRRGMGWGLLESHEARSRVSRRALALATLENIVGRDKVLPCLVKGSASEAIGADGVQLALGEVAGDELVPLVNACFGEASDVDFSVESLESAPGAVGFASRFVLRRRGSLVLGVVVELTIEGDEPIRLMWDDGEPVLEREMETRGRLLRVRIDPDRKILLDDESWNDARSLAPATLGTRRARTSLLRRILALLQHYGSLG
jgi:hypothetical protein